MDAEDTHDGGRNHRPYMDSFGVDKFQSIVEKIFNNSRTLRTIDAFIFNRRATACSLLFPWLMQPGRLGTSATK